MEFMTTGAGVTVTVLGRPLMRRGCSVVIDDGGESAKKSSAVGKLAQQPIVQRGAVRWGQTRAWERSFECGAQTSRRLFVLLTIFFLDFVRISIFNNSLKSEATPPVLLV